MPTPIPATQNRDLIRLINETYTDEVEEILEARLEDDGAILAIARDEDRIVVFKYTDDIVLVNLANPEVIEDLDEDDRIDSRELPNAPPEEASLWAAHIVNLVSEAAERSDAVERTDKKACKKGLPCGNSCIARNKTCRKKLTGSTLNKAKAVSKAKPKKTPKKQNKVAQLNTALQNRDFDKAATIADDIYQSARARATAAGGDFYEGIRAGNNSTEDWILKEIYSQQGYDKKPKQVKTAKAITNAYNNGQYVAYRAMGSTDARFNQHFDNFKNGDYFAGHGIYGHGTYVAYAVQGGTHSRKTAVDEASPYGSGVMRLALAGNTKIVDQSDNQNDFRAMDSMLKTWYQQTGNRQAYRRLRRVVIGDGSGASTSGRLAAIKGYDAIRLNMAHNTTYMNLLNRSKVTVQSTPGTLYTE